MTERRTFEDEQTRVDARALYDEGLGCNAIARELNISASSVSLWAKREGLKFDRAQVAEANRAHVADLAAARIRLATKLTTVAESALDSLDEEYLVYNFGGKDNEYREHTLSKAPMDARRTAVTMGAVAFDKVSRIVERETDVTGAESTLAALKAGFHAVIGDVDSASDDDVEAEG
ncbi:hypothetical protein [Mycetocola saprophilus]|uniref:hypothetical protein n=1 Tax=Mycetocola saprophilus TaxID=76636 RepID=UPI000689734A|nr:hypothetical protein [Mycetocola saprophilus]